MPRRSQKPLSDEERVRKESVQPLTVSPETAALMLGMGRDAVYALLERRELPAFKVGRAYKIPVAILDEWVLRQAQKGAQINV